MKQGYAQDLVDDGRPVAFTPKGGCPLKLLEWVDVEVYFIGVAFTPKGGCPLKLVDPADHIAAGIEVAFTPKGGCPLKQ